MYLQAAGAVLASAGAPMHCHGSFAPRGKLLEGGGDRCSRTSNKAKQP